jgi:DNA transposition AAA+ family ATPase
MSQKTRLIEVAKQIRDWQVGRGLSDNELCKRFTGLGSTKTYKRILEEELEELDLERWGVEYEQVRTLLDLESQNADIEEPVYDDLWHITATRLAVSDAMKERGNNRLVIIEGQSGSGKSTAARCMAAKFGRKIVLVEADETWKGPNLGGMLSGLLRALQVREAPISGDGKLHKIIDVLSQSPVCLAIDEAHHLGPRTLNIVKSILNQTPCQVVFLCIPTLFRRLETEAYEEAKQLTQNRLCERVKLNGPALADVERFFERRLTWETESDGRKGETHKGCAKLCAEQARRHGYWNFVNLVVRKCRELAGKRPVDRDTFAKALAKAQQSR